LYVRRLKCASTTSWFFLLLLLDLAIDSPPNLQQTALSMPPVFRDVTASREVDEKAILRKQDTAENTANVAVGEQGDGRNAVGKRTGRDGNSSGIALTTGHTIARDKQGPGAVWTKRRQRHDPLKGCQL
jgi:hypothetical protein